ncbi:MAG: four helix bundle protein [Patescibacteria group bacterium]
MQHTNQNFIKSFRDLLVYQNSYEASIIIAKQILPKLPAKEKFDLTDQLSRSSKAIPRLIAEGYGKKHRKYGFQKYLDDAMAESNETIVSLEHVKDIYAVEIPTCNQLIDTYDKTSRQLYKLAEAWNKFKNRSRETSNDTAI